MLSSIDTRTARKLASTEQAPFTAQSQGRSASSPAERALRNATGRQLPSARPTGKSSPTLRATREANGSPMLEATRPSEPSA
jgi:hypothetical protein